MFNLGSSAASTGALTYTAGYIYNGNIQRWYPTTAVAVGSAASLFPIGTGTDYRPIYFGSSGLTTGGTIKARHTSIVGSTTVSFADGASTIQKQSSSYWTVTTGNGIASGGTPFSIRTEGTGFGTVGAVTDLRITKNGVAAPGADGAHAGTTTNPQVNRTGISLANLPNNYYWGSINSVQTPLPVGLYSFKGNDVQGRVYLTWSTETEVNNDHFTVYHSDDGETFIAIGTVKGKGTYAGQSDYRLTHANPVQGANYYKLQQTDFNGVATDLKVIKVLVDGVFPGVQVYPNPVRSGEYFHIAFSHLAPSESTDVQIINIQGQLVHQFTAKTDAAGNITYDLQPALSPGLYIMKAGTFRTRIIVQ